MGGTHLDTYTRGIQPTHCPVSCNIFIHRFSTQDRAAMDRIVTAGKMMR